MRLIVTLAWLLAPAQVAAKTAPAVAAMLPVWVRGVPGEMDGQAPHTPDGMPHCVRAQEPVGELPRLAGETIRYVVDVDGLSLGTIDFRIERRGLYQGRPVVEYRSLFKLDSLVATFVPLEGRAATLVNEASYWPEVAMNRYRLDKNDIEENSTYTQAGRRVMVKRSKDGKANEESRSFPIAVQDFVTAFYLLRRLPVTQQSCTIIYGNLRAYTVWIVPQGQEEVKTPVGLRLADKYEIRYASDKSVKPVLAHVWLGRDADRLPYQADLDAAHHLEARIHLYQPGKATQTASAVALPQP